MKPSNLKICQEAAQLLRSRQYPAAESLLKNLIAQSPKDAQAHGLLAHSLMRQKKVDESLQAFATAIDCNPKSADAHGDMGRACLHAKQNN